MANQGEWKLVSRRRRYPESWREKTAQPPKTVARPFVPYAQTYAQVVAEPGVAKTNPTLNHHPKPSLTIAPALTTTTSAPSFPNHRPPSKTYISPHSPTSLRFPPSPFFIEWRGRCFRCCRTGHAAASCRFQAKCGKCWADGHVGSRCPKEPKQSLNPAAKPFLPSAGHEATNLEPSFDAMLTGTYPYVPPVMPESRSLMHTCFVERDAEYYSELERLKSAIVVKTADGLEVEKIAKLIAGSGLVQEEDLSFASLTRGRYLVHLPNGHAPDPIIRAIPARAWDMGLDFQQWSPLDYAAINIPNYKLIINLLDVPPLLYRERQMIRATSGIGVYLGTIAQADPLNVEVWTAVIATDNLERVPPAVTMVMGGLQFTMPIRVLKVSQGPIYNPQDLPTMPQKYKKPVLEQLDEGKSSREEEEEDDEHLFTCSTKVLQDLCEGRDQNSIPPEIHAMLAGSKRPRLSKEVLLAILLHHEPVNFATENPSTNSVGESEAYLGPGTQDPVNHDVQQLISENFGGQTMLQTERPQGILCVGETSGVIKEGTAFASKNDGSGISRRDNLRSRTSRGGKINKGKARSLIKAKSNGHQGREVGPVPMKKHVKRVISKTSNGLLHRRPHGKDTQHHPLLLPRGGKSKRIPRIPLAEKR